MTIVLNIDSQKLKKETLVVWKTYNTKDEQTKRGFWWKAQKTL